MRFCQQGRRDLRTYLLIGKITPKNPDSNKNNKI